MQIVSCEGLVLRWSWKTECTVCKNCVKQYKNCYRWEVSVKVACLCVCVCGSLLFCYVYTGLRESVCQSVSSCFSSSFTSAAPVASAAVAVPTALVSSLFLSFPGDEKSQASVSLPPLADVVLQPLLVLDHCSSTLTLLLAHICSALVLGFRVSVRLGSRSFF